MTLHFALKTSTPRNTVVYNELTYAPVAGVANWAPTGVYEIEKLSSTMWVLTHTAWAFDADGKRTPLADTVRRVKDLPALKRLSDAKGHAEDDNKALKAGDPVQGRVTAMAYA